MNKLEEQIWKRYGNFELSHDKNKLIVDNIKEFTTDVAIKFAEWCNKPDSKDVRQSNVVYVPSNNFYWYNHKKYTPEELFEEFINNHYGK
jgi:hypothetical protein